MFEELTWMEDTGIKLLFYRFSEDQLREVINWLDWQDAKIKAKVKPILERELNRRAIKAYEELNNGEWI